MSGAAYCEGCDGAPIPGIRWPTRTNDDGSRDWVERCDTCERYASDDEAAEAVVAFYAGAGTPKRVEYAVPVGLTYTHPYVSP